MRNIPMILSFYDSFRYVENSGKGITLKIQGRLCPIFPKSFKKKNESEERITC